MGRARINPLRRRRDTATLALKHVLFGGGLFDVSGEHPNKKGWDIFELGQRSFWAVPSAIDWDAPVEEDPEYAEAIAAMLTFLCPGEKAAVTGASLVSTQVTSEEAKFYFVEQAMEEAKHFDAMRRVIPLISGQPVEPPTKWVRMLYSYGVIDPKNVAFTMCSINIIGEHLASSILHKIAHVAVSPTVKQLLALIAKDEARHVGAGKRFFPEVYDEYKRTRHEIAARNVATTIVLALAGAELVGPMKKLGLDLAEVMDAMYLNYEDVTGGLPPFPDQIMFEMIIKLVKTATPATIRAIGAVTDEHGHPDRERFLATCARAATSPRALREIFAL